MTVLLIDDSSCDERRRSSGAGISRPTFEMLPFTREGGSERARLEIEDSYGQPAPAADASTVST